MAATSRAFSSPNATLVKFAAFFSIAAAFIHSYVVPEHLNEWWGYGAFFIAATVLQALYGLVLLTQPWRYEKDGSTKSNRAGYERSVYLLGIVGNAAVIGLYIVTRTVGIPLFGPEAGEVEPVTILGILSKATEVLIVVCLVQLYRRVSRGV